MSWFDFLRQKEDKPDVRDTLRLPVEEFDKIPARSKDEPQGDQIGDQWRVRRRNFRLVDKTARYDCGWDYFTVLGFTDSDNKIIYSMRLEAWDNGRRVF
jgi:hypothetical protein